jgi:glucose-specific phosphotransferase system IIA component
MFFIRKKSKVVAVVDGIIHQITTYPDEAISHKLLGDGFFIEPTGELICSPIDGEVVMMFPTTHAAAVRNHDYEILIHIGVNTVKLGGKGFHALVKQGAIVKAGDPLVKLDLEVIKAAQEVKALSTAVLFTSGDKKVSVKEPGTQVKAGQSNIVTVESL